MISSNGSGGDGGDGNDDANGDRDGNGDGRQAVIFDFDGVIALSEPTHARAWHDVAAAYGRDLPKGFIDASVGNPGPLVADILGEAWGGLSGAKILEDQQRHARLRMIDEVELVPGVRSLIERLLGRYPLAIATSSTREDLEPIMEREDLWAKFDAVLTIDSVTRPKPDPEIYLSAAKALGADPRRCWVFEDSVHGVNAARSAGMKVVGITTSFTAQALQPLEAYYENFLNRVAIETLIANGAD